MLDNVKVTSLHNYEDEESTGSLGNACAIKSEQTKLYFSMYIE